MTRMLIAILIALTLQACAQEKAISEKPTIDKRVELISIIFRLADKQGYADNTFKLYSDRVDQYFGKYKNHELIHFTRSIISERGIAFDGPMWLALHLDDNLKLRPGVTDVWQHDPRWTKEYVEKFVSLLQQFRKKTRFDKFFRDNADLYAEAAKCFAPLYEQADSNWCASFFGKEPSETFLTIIGMGVWGNCFGVNVDYPNGGREVYAIMGLRDIDHAGLPVFSKFPNLPILIHEFSHPFVDGLTAKHKGTFRDSGEKIYTTLKDALETEAYPSWEVVLDEALINASVTMYMKDHGFEQSEIASWTKLIKEAFGFFWIEELMGELERYEQQRDKYPTIESYMPQLAEAYKSWTVN